MKKVERAATSRNAALKQLFDAVVNPLLKDTEEYMNLLSAVSDYLKDNDAMRLGELLDDKAVAIEENEMEEENDESEDSYDYEVADDGSEL